MKQVANSAQIGRTNSAHSVRTSFLETLAGRASALPYSMSSAEGNSIKTHSQVNGPLLCRKDAAKYLGVASQTLAQWACSGRVALPFVRTGRKVGYRQTDLDAFITANTYGGSND